MLLFKFYESTLPILSLLFSLIECKSNCFDLLHGITFPTPQHWVQNYQFNVYMTFLLGKSEYLQVLNFGHFHSQILMTCLQLPNDHIKLQIVSVDLVLFLKVFSLKQAKNKRSYGCQYNLYTLHWHEKPSCANIQFQARQR